MTLIPGDGVGARTSSVCQGSIQVAMTTALSIVVCLQANVVPPKHSSTCIGTVYMCIIFTYCYNLRVSAYVHAYTCVGVCTCICVCTCMCVCARVPICMCAHVLNQGISTYYVYPDMLTYLLTLKKSV